MSGLPRLSGCALFLAATFASIVGAAAQTASERAAISALQLFNTGSYQEAAEAYGNLLRDYPSSAEVLDARLHLGYCESALGRHAEAAEQFRKLIEPPAPPELQQLAHLMLAHALAGKAGAIPESKPAARKEAFGEAIKQFGVVIGKFPSSEDIESARYGRAVCCYLTGQYPEAEKDLRDNLKAFPRSETILDSQYLLAIALATRAGGESGANKLALYGDAEKLLRDIIARNSDVALVNDAWFQLGETLFNQALATDEARRGPVFAQALDAYHSVLPQDAMLRAQERRLATVRERISAAVGNLAQTRTVLRVLRREQAKLAQLRDKPAQWIAALIKTGEIHLQLGRHDEARVVMQYASDFAATDEQKKTALYCITVSYALQGQAKKAVESYDKFQAAWKADPIADNLPLLIGQMFLSPGSNDPKRALAYFKESLVLYPKGRFTGMSLLQQAVALSQLRQFGEAIKTFRNFLSKKPDRKIAAVAELGIANIHAQTGKWNEAIAAYRKVRTGYDGTPQQDEAAFRAGWALLQKGDARGAVPELRAYVKKFPEGPFHPGAEFTLAQALSAAGDIDAALGELTQIGKRFPKSTEAPFSYFERAQILVAAGRLSEVPPVMREFIEKHPDDDKVFFAFDNIAQVHLAAGDREKAIASYEEFLGKHSAAPQAAEAQFKVVTLWRDHAHAQGRYAALNDEQRAEWEKGVKNSLAAAEKLLGEHPGSKQFPLGIEAFVAVQEMLVEAGLRDEAAVEKAMRDLANKLKKPPATRKRILFALAGWRYDRGNAKAFDEMAAAFDEKLRYAPADLDCYGMALLARNRADDAGKVFRKMARDYPTPPGIEPGQAPREIQEAQATALYGLGKVFEAQHKPQPMQQQFDRLKKLYPWSPRILEADFGIARTLQSAGKTAEAKPLLVGIIRSTNATADLRARAMLQLAHIFKAENQLEPAIDNFIKIAAFYGGVPDAAAEGLWEGAQLLEKQMATLTDPTRKNHAAGNARRAYAELVGQYGSSKWAKDAQARLDALGSGK